MRFGGGMIVTLSASTAIDHDVQRRRVRNITMYSLAVHCQAAEVGRRAPDFEFPARDADTYSSIKCL